MTNTNFEIAHFVHSEKQNLKMDLLGNRYPEHLIDTTIEECQNIRKRAGEVEHSRTVLLLYLKDFFPKK